MTDDQLARLTRLALATEQGRLAVDTDDEEFALVVLKIIDYCSNGRLAEALEEANSRFFADDQQTTALRDAIRTQIDIQRAKQAEIDRCIGTITGLDGRPIRPIRR